MKQALLVFSSVLLISFGSNAQSLKGLIKKDSTGKTGVQKIIGGSSKSGLSTDEVASGLKEALNVGTNNATKQLSNVDGFFKDAAVKILMPEQVQKVEKKMRMLGMGKMVDNAILSMNRAAEDASKSAAPIFIDAIKQMSVTDALSILKGTDTVATSYLKKTTTNPLTESFRPVIEASLKKVDATKYWKDVFSVYNKFSSKPVNTDLNAYVTEKALSGIFYYVAEEEKKIRKDPAARATDILKKVFGSK